MKATDAARKALGTTASSGSGAKVKEMRIRHADSGGYIATHTEHQKKNGKRPDFEEAMSHQQEHVLPNMQALQQHIEQHMPEEAPQAGGDANDPEPAPAAATQGQP